MPSKASQMDHRHDLAESGRAEQAASVLENSRSGVVATCIVCCIMLKICCHLVEHSPRQHSAVGLNPPCVGFSFFSLEMSGV